MKWSLLAETACTLGEGVSWSSRRQAVMFVDIVGQRILQYSLSSRTVHAWRVPQPVGWLIPRKAQAGFLAGFRQGFGFIDPVEGADTCTDIEWLARPFEEGSPMRLNDAKADPQGRVWAGCLNNDDESQPVGMLHRLSTDGALQMVDEGYCVPNGPAVSPDGTLFLHTDSARQTIYAFDFDAGAGTLRNKRIWRRFSPEEGYPDGMNFDARGHVWIAHWGSGLVSQFSATGDLLQRVDLPVSNVTNLAFGAQDLDRLFVTTARKGLSEAQLAAEPLAGSLFEIIGHGATGKEPLPFGG